MSLVDCEGFLPPDEPVEASAQCRECGCVVWVDRERLVRGLCEDCAPVEMVA